MYVVTNGVAATQEKRMREAGIEDCFRVVFNSESIGAQKPSAAFFDYVFAHIDGFDRTRALLIEGFADGGHRRRQKCGACDLLV